MQGSNEENTKEIENLDKLKEMAIDTLELDIIESMDENLESAEEMFESRLEEQQENSEEETPIENQEKEKKKKTFKEKIKNLKDKWMTLPKKKKVTLILIGIILILLIGIGIYFLISKPQEEPTKEIENIIVDLDNYRYENGKLVFLDSQKKEIGEYTCKNENQDLCYIAYYSDEDNFDEPKYIYENQENIKKRSQIYLNKYVFIYDNKEKENGLITLYNIETQEEIDKYILIKGYENIKNKIVIKNKTGQYGYFEFTEEKMNPIINFSYDYFGIISSKENIDRAVTKRNGKWYLTDFTDKTLTKAIALEIKDYNDYGIKVQDAEGKYHFVDYNGVEVNPASYDYIDLLDQYIFYINDQKIYIKDYENHKMNLDGIELKNSNYIKTYTYSKENKLIKTEKSYEVTYQGKTMIIEIFESDSVSSNKKSINLNEGRVSATLAYLDYFDGHLYLYKDTEKTNLLGTYECENKNNLGDEAASLTNCKPAKESYYQDNDIEKSIDEDLGVLPLYNERYIFIEDSNVPQSDNTTIVLYDLKENSSKAKYKSVDAGAYTKNQNLSLVTVNNNHIIAENKNGQYGIIQINYNSVEGVKEFNYNHIERIGLYYIVQNSSGYALMDHSGSVLTSAVTNKIRNFNMNAKYFVTKDQKYHLYSFEGESMTPSGFDYIALDDEYFSAVNNHTLNFYSYKKPEEALTEGVKLERNNYFGEGTLAFIASFQKDKVTVKIGRNDNSYDTKTFSLKEEGEGEPNEPTAT